MYKLYTCTPVRGRHNRFDDLYHTPTYIRQGGWFEAGKVREKNPVPTSQKYILSFDVTMIDLLSVTLLKDFEELKHYPFLLHYAKEGTSAGGGRERERERDLVYYTEKASVQ